MSVPQPQVSDWENDRYEMLDTKTLMRIGKELKVSMDAIVEGLDVGYDRVCQTSTQQSASHQGGSDVPASSDRVDRELRELREQIENWFVDPAKGDNGSVVYMNDDMLNAWRLFIAADAWGHYDGRSFAKTLRRNGWPKNVDPYNLRHTVGLTLSELGVDLGDIQVHMGHSSPATTRQFYVPGVPARLKDASDKLDGRMGIAAAVPELHARRAATRRDKSRKTPTNPRPLQIVRSADRSTSKRSKTA